jgi:predicted transcriptional regulator
VPRRERATILGELLEVLAEGEASSEPPSSTRMAARANLPYDRFAAYLDDLVRRGLVQAGPRPALTAAGREVLERFRAWREGLRLFGLPAEEPERPKDGPHNS